jgi:regulator of sirC expression with transglutaminase-like and TPR domain
MSAASEWDFAPLAAVLAPDGLRCSLEEAALILARQEIPDLDPRPWLVRLDAFAALARPMLSERPDTPETIGVVNDVLFRDAGFHGNETEYYDPRNSFLNEVLERRTGIPITLALIYMAVARRLGLILYGTAFPGHFLLVSPRAGWPIVLDAFDRGCILSEKDCKARVAAMGGRWDPRFLDPVSPRAILRRMLENLKRIYFEQRDWPRLLRTVTQILALDAAAHDEHFTRGVAFAGAGEPARAIVELETFLARCPGAANQHAARELLAELRRAGSGPLGSL